MAKRIKQKQHELPKLYLKGFSFKEKSDHFIWVFDRRLPHNQNPTHPSANPQKVSIKNASVIKDRYAVCNSDGSKDTNTFEDALQKQETQCDLILSKIRKEQSLGAADKDKFARYLQMMLKRTTNRDNTMIPSLNLDQNNIAAQLMEWASYYALLGNFKASRRLSDTQKAVETGYLKFMVLRKTMIMASPETHRQLTSPNWGFFVAPEGSYFVTSDNPVIRTGPLESMPVIFPISSKVSLVIAQSNPQDLEFIQATASQVKVLNYCAICQAMKIYSSTAERSFFEIWEQGLMMNEEEEKSMREIWS